MNRIAKFSKVSFEQFLKDWCDTFNLENNNSETISDVREVWNNIKLPTRATTGSAGYDFNSIYSFTLEPNGTIKIPTGIKCEIKEDWVLTLYPRSSLGIKKKMFITNTIPVIDSDYFENVNNEGHIFVFITNNGNEAFRLNEGESFMQGIFLPYGITLDDNADGIRNGGFGSTGR